MSPIALPPARASGRAALQTATHPNRLGPRESVGAFRAVHFGRTEEEAVALFRDTNYAGFYHYFGGFGFAEAFRLACWMVAGRWGLDGVKDSSPGSTSDMITMPLGTKIL